MCCLISWSYTNIVKLAMQLKQESDLSLSSYLACKPKLFLFGELSCGVCKIGLDLDRTLPSTQTW